MTKSLENEGTILNELADAKSRDEDLRDTLDHVALQQQAFVQKMVEAFMSIATPSAVISEDYKQLQASMETDLMNSTDNGPQSIRDEDFARLQVSSQRLVHVREKFVSLVRYDHMYEREAGVVEAHEVTLRWIFDQSSASGETPWHNFSRWLESDNRIYWITGKMGSGKSTLMKYVSQELPKSSTKSRERRCTPYLLRWATDQPLFIATFYFWAGSNQQTKLQTSVQGLYRTILTQILEAYPEAAPRLSPRRWEDLWRQGRIPTDSRPPDGRELERMLKIAIDYVSSKAKICLFIDGLDEFEGSKCDRQNLIAWVKKTTQTLPIKMCVASRPWRVFEDALEQGPHLLMEDFNSDDIRKYVSAQFLNNRYFEARKRIEAAPCDQLVNDVVAKAEGVFLWVRLVCTSLLEAMSEGEVMGRLKKILEDLPVEMEDLYDHILDNLELSHKDHAVQYLLLMQAYMGTPNALTFSLADEIREDSNFPFKMPRAELTDAELQFRGNELNKRLNSRCRGLLSLALETSVDHDVGKAALTRTGTVQYCHTSAKDYLTKRNSRNKLKHMLEAGFDPHLRLCAAFLALWKTCEGPPRGGREIMYLCVLHAAKADIDSSRMMIRLLDDFNTTLGGRLDFRDEGTDGHGLENLIRYCEGYVHDIREWAKLCWFGGTFLSVTVAFGVVEYVKHKMGGCQGCMVESSLVFVRAAPERYNCPLGDRSKYSVQRAYVREINIMVDNMRPIRGGAPIHWSYLLDAILISTIPDPDMVSLLLENGADPNLIIRRGAWKTSAWKAVSSRLRILLPHASLSHLPEGIEFHCRTAWEETLCLLLRHGCKPDLADVPYLRWLLGEHRIKAERLPHIGRHREIWCRLLRKCVQEYGEWHQF